MTGEGGREKKEREQRREAETLVGTSMEEKRRIDTHPTSLRMTSSQRHTPVRGRGIPLVVTRHAKDVCNA